MKFYLIALLLLTSLFGIDKNLSTFEADFVQKVEVPDSEDDLPLIWEGKIYAKSPDMVLWSYTKPEHVNKQVYVNKERVITIQNELEQAIITHLKQEINFFTLLESAKKVDQNTYKANFNDITFTIYEKDGVITSLIYSDKANNITTITFSNQKSNHPLDEKLFNPVIPRGFDIMTQ